MDPASRPKQPRDGRVICIGECMVELARGNDGRFGLSYGGDTFNTAVYLARSGATVSYATELGDDPYSDGIAALASDEGVDCTLIPRRTGRMPGLYLIETTQAGERSFYYWRDRSPARELFDGDAASRVADAMKSASIVYLSGITLSLYGPAALDRLADALDAARKAGALVAMDSNYRPRGWAGDAERARSTLARFWNRCDIALPTLDDETMLWGDVDAAATIERLSAHGIREVAVKEGPIGATVTVDGTQARIAVPGSVTPVDTTAAGDSFNAGYLARRLAGDDFEAAVLTGHRLASIVICHRGAIVPRAATAAPA